MENIIYCKKLKIETEGTPASTKLYLDDEMVSCLKSIQLKVDVDGDLIEASVEKITDNNNVEYQLIKFV